MQLKNIIIIPPRYRNREDKINQLKISEINYIMESPNFIVSSIINKHVCVVKFLQPDHIDLNSSILIDCTCESFKYEFAYPNKEHLLFPEKYIDKKPIKKNIYLLEGVCKHIYKLGRFIFANKNKILEKIKGE